MNKPRPTASDPLILALDTSSKVTSLAIAGGGEPLTSIKSQGDEKRSEKLWSEIQALLAGRRLTMVDVDVFAVCTGPGGFTGLRVGIAAVKGFAAALSKPVCGVTSLQAAAFAAGPASKVYAMVNAYKNEVYSQLFSAGGDEGSRDLPVALNEPLVSSVQEALDRVHDLKDAVGAVEIEAEQLQHRAYAFASGKWTIDRSEQLVAENIARMALIRYKRGELESAGALKACYVRPSEAEIKLSLGLLGSKIKRNMKR